MCLPCLDASESVDNAAVIFATELLIVQAHNVDI